MRHHNSVFHDLLKRVPWAEFDRLTNEHGADRRVRRLPTKSQFIALLYGQLSGAASLRLADYCTVCMMPGGGAVVACGGLVGLRIWPRVEAMAMSLLGMRLILVHLRRQARTH